jgi:hypothetical protein
MVWISFTGKVVERDLHDGGYIQNLKELDISCLSLTHQADIPLFARSPSDFARCRPF